MDTLVLFQIGNIQEILTTKNAGIKKRPFSELHITYSFRPNHLMIIWRCKKTSQQKTGGINKKVQPSRHETKKRQ